MENREEGVFGLQYICPFCLHRMRLNRFLPPEWKGEWRGEVRDELRKTCDRCGRMSVPEELWPGSPAEMSEHLWRAFSCCPNARFCEGHDQYDAQCERRALMPKCLHGVCTTLDSLDFRMRALEEKKKLRPRRPKPGGERDKTRN